MGPDVEPQVLRILVLDVLTQDEGQVVPIHDDMPVRDGATP
jgi:hypothetical protein